MRAFNPSTVLLSGEAKHDRIKVRVTMRIGYSSVEQLSEYMEHIGDQSGLVARPLFRVQSDRTPHTRTLRVMSGWLFSGSGRLHHANAAQGGIATLVLELDLNPTRFLAHHRAGASVVELEAMSPEEALATCPDNEAPARAAALDGNDNVLLGTLRQGGTTLERRGEWWRERLGLYLRHVEALLHARLVPTMTNALPPVHVTAPSFDAVAQAECYWELETNRARTVVALLADRLRAASGQFRLRMHLPSVEEIEEGHDQNSNSVTLHLGRGIQFCVYAKTADRVRFEMRYLADVRDNAARSLHGPVNILTILEAAREDAARRMTRIRETLAMTLAPTSFDRRHLMDFLRELLYACDGDRDAAEQLMEGLVNFGGVTQTPAGGIAPPEALRRLERRRIIRRLRVRARGAPRFVLAPPYATLQRALLAALPEHCALNAR
jgi:hypothetical protein